MSATPDIDSQPPAPTIAAVLLPAERQRVDAAGTGCFAVLHRESLADAIHVVRQRPVHALLLSVHRCRPEHVESVSRLVREFPSVPTVALLSHHNAEASDMLLRLGATGVQQVVDVTSSTGWNRLRELVGQPATLAAARIQGIVLAAAATATPDARLFLEVLIRIAPVTPTARELAARLQVRPSTLMSRFVRAGLPSPKNYLTAVRLLHAAHCFEDAGLSVADVAYRLDYSSPQSFGRHVRSLLGITSTEFRQRYPFATAVGRFVELMVAPYKETLERFHPLIVNS